MSMTKTAVAANTMVNLGPVMPCLIYAESDLYVAHGAAPASSSDMILFRTTNLNNHITLGWVSTDDVHVFSRTATTVIISRP